MPTGHAYVIQSCHVWLLVSPMLVTQFMQVALINMGFWAPTPSPFVCQICFTSGHSAL